MVDQKDVLSRGRACNMVARLRVEQTAPAVMTSNNLRLDDPDQTPQP